MTRQRATPSASRAGQLAAWAAVALWIAIVSPWALANVAPVPVNSLGFGGVWVFTGLAIVLFGFPWVGLTTFTLILLERRCLRIRHLLVFLIGSGVAVIGVTALVAATHPPASFALDFTGFCHGSPCPRHGRYFVVNVMTGALHLILAYLVWLGRAVLSRRFYPGGPLWLSIPWRFATTVIAITVAALLVTTLQWWGGQVRLSVVEFVASQTTKTISATASWLDSICSSCIQPQVLATGATLVLLLVGIGVGAGWFGRRTAATYALILGFLILLGFNSEASTLTDPISWNGIALISAGVILLMSSRRRSRDFESTG
jgi:hypothetical protein